MTSKLLFERNSLHLDYFKDYKDRICQVFTWHHPNDRRLCIVKYDLGDSFWVARDTGLRYTRMLKSYSFEGHQENLKEFQKIEPDYHYHSDMYGVEFLAVPLDRIKEYYYPEKRLQQILETNAELDAIELKVKRIAEHLNEFLEIPLGNMGITGSILWKGQTEKSDVDFIIYGNEYAQEFNEKFPLLYKKTEEIKPLPQKKLHRYEVSMAKKSGLPIEMTRKYVAKKSWLSIFNETNISMIFSPTVDEVPFTYGSQLFEPINIIDISCEIVDTKMGFAYPAIYEIDDCEIIKGEKKIKDYELTRVLSFEGAFTGYFKVGEKIVIRGLLEKVINKDGNKTFYQMILGTKEGLGDEFILLEEDYLKLQKRIAL